MKLKVFHGQIRDGDGVTYSWIVGETRSGYLIDNHPWMDQDKAVGLAETLARRDKTVTAIEVYGVSGLLDRVIGVR